MYCAVKEVKTQILGKQILGRVFLVKEHVHAHYQKQKNLSQIHQKIKMQVKETGQKIERGSLYKSKSQWPADMQKDAQTVIMSEM